MTPYRDRLEAGEYGSPPESTTSDDLAGLGAAQQEEQPEPKTSKRKNAG